MESWQALPQVALARPGALASRFAALGPRDLRAAARYVNALPYGRSSSRENPALVLDEGRGTCSSKHTLLALLAHEQGIAVELMLGIYEMREANTPGVGRVLERYGIPALPEGHCYLRYAGKRIDITRVVTGARAPIEPFLYEETIRPEQVAEYKVELHRRFMRDWLARNPLAGNPNFERVWAIREECIAALSE